MTSQYLTIAVVNNSGNVGKSTVCDVFLKPRIENAQTIKIESINDDDTTDEKFRGGNIKDIFAKIDSNDISIIDVGASNIESFMSNLSKLDGAYEDIDIFVIPTTTHGKQQKDTITTVEGLLYLGVEPERIKIVFNFFDDDYSVPSLYPIIFESSLVKSLKLDKVSNIFSINKNPIFDMLGEIGATFSEIANDERDFKTLTRQTTDKDERLAYSHLRTANRLAKGFNKELDTLFAKFMKSCKNVIGE